MPAFLFGFKRMNLVRKNQYSFVFDKLTAFPADSYRHFPLCNIYYFKAVMYMRRKGKILTALYLKIIGIKRMF